MFINIADIYCFGTGLPISLSKDIYQCCHIKYNCKLTLQIFELRPKSEGIVQFIVCFCSFHYHVLFW